MTCKLLLGPLITIHCLLQKRRVHASREGRLWRGASPRGAAEDGVAGGERQQGHGGTRATHIGDTSTALQGDTVLRTTSLNHGRNFALSQIRPFSLFLSFV